MNIEGIIRFANSRVWIYPRLNKLPKPCNSTLTPSENPDIPYSKATTQKKVTMTNRHNHRKTFKKCIVGSLSLPKNTSSVQTDYSPTRGQLILSVGWHRKSVVKYPDGKNCPIPELISTRAASYSGKTQRINTDRIPSAIRSVRSRQEYHQTDTGWHRSRCITESKPWQYISMFFLIVGFPFRARTIWSKESVVKSIYRRYTLKWSIILVSWKLFQAPTIILVNDHFAEFWNQCIQKVRMQKNAVFWKYVCRSTCCFTCKCWRNGFSLIRVHYWG